MRSFHLRSMTLPRLLLFLVLASCTLGGAGVRVSDAPQGVQSPSVAGPGLCSGGRRLLPGLVVARVLPLATAGVGSQKGLRLRGGYGKEQRKKLYFTIQNGLCIPLIPPRLLLPFVDTRECQPWHLPFSVLARGGQRRYPELECAAVPRRARI